MSDLRRKIEDELTGPGGPWEIVEEDVRGERLPVFAHRLHSLPELLAQSSRYDGREAMVAGDRRITFAQQRALVVAAVQVLRDEYGIGPGDRVALWGANHPEWVLAWWAAVSLGAIVAAFNDRWTAPEVAHAFDNAQPAVLLGDDACLARAREGTVRLARRMSFPAFGDAVEAAAVSGSVPDADGIVPKVAIAEDDPALILYTSGTTGRSKGALISHRGLLGFLQVNACNAAIGAAMAARFGLDLSAEPARLLLTSPLFHMSGLMAGVLLSTVGGDTMIMPPGRFDPATTLRIIERERVTHFSPLGSTGPRILDAMEHSSYDVSSMRQLGFGGAPLSPALRRRLMTAFPNAGRVGMGYGSSETVSVVTSIGGPEFDAHPTSAGRVLPTVAVEIRDGEGAAVPDGVDGEIHVRSAYVMLGYWRDPAATSAVCKPGGWLATGDIGRMEAGMLTIDSRARDMILRSGENIYPVEIEHRLMEHPAVAEVAVLGADHPVFGQEVRAVVVLRSGATATPGELADFARAALASYKVPSVWELRPDALPRNAAGKVQKNLL